MFSTFKRTDPHTDRGRPTRKDGVVIYERIFRNGSFCELKIAKESQDFAKILLRSNQKSNELSMNRKYEQSVTTDERRALLIKTRCIVIKLLETPEETTTKIPCLTREVDVGVKINVIVYIHVTSIMIITFTMFLQQQTTTKYFISPHSYYNIHIIYIHIIYTYNE